MEVVLVILLVLWQLYVLRLVIKKDNLIKTILPAKTDIYLSQANTHDLEPVEGDNLDETNIKHKPQRVTSVLAIDNSKNKNSLLKEIVTSINDYLKNNKGNAADFHLLKDIVDRHLDTIDEEISHLLPVPLYLGLAGTMLGIILGLFSIDGDVTTDSFMLSISSVISNIKYAMICSLSGLLITTFLSAKHYRTAKATMEKQKNTLLDFLQANLLPHLNEDALATLNNLQANLQAFNNDFSDHIIDFSGILDDVHESFASQVQLVKELKSIGLVKMSGLNIAVLDKLNVSMKKFDQFASYLDNMNGFVGSAMRLATTLDSELERTDEISKLVVGFRENIEKNHSVMSNLNAFLSKIDSNKAIIQASENVDSSVKSIMSALEEHVADQADKLKRYTEKATQDLESLMNREKGQLDRLKNLDKLDELVKVTKEMGAANKEINVALAKRIASLTESINDSPVYGGNSNTVLPKWLAYPVAIIIAVACGCFIYDFISQFLSK